MIYKQIDNITEDDLQALIDNKVIERKTLEYKRQLPGGFRLPEEGVPS